jgi:lipopolysaccharide transport system ATP-binding protein
MQPVIQISGLYKQYRLGMISNKYLFRDVQSWWAKVRGKEDPNSRIDFTSNVQRPTPNVQTSNDDDRFWALKDINLEVHQGEIVGIIGRNGAGKSTLLKILSRVTAPTKGEIKIKGRIASLLEVGTGFHPELTGRENVFQNGAILGMRKSEIKKKFDEIVNFAEVEKFIDTPVKRYSSGMYVRLAFAVAAHLDPEILVIDEVLAVGDAQFQKKCLGKMGEASKEHGKTVLIVSHNMPVIMTLCKKAIFIKQGAIINEGLPSNVVPLYLNSAGSSKGEIKWNSPQEAPGNDVVRLHAVRIVQDNSEGSSGDVDMAREVQVHILYWCMKSGTPLMTAIWLKDKSGVAVLSSSNLPSVSLSKDPWGGKEHFVGLYKSVCTIPANFLNDGTYYITPIIDKNGTTTQIVLEDAL